MIAEAVDKKTDEAEALKMAFLRWQCRVRQIAMRESAGKPDPSSMPSVTLRGAPEPLGSIITQLCKQEAFSQLPELQHMARKSQDPSEIRTKAVQFFSESYFQRPREFSDLLTASFAPESTGAQTIVAAGECKLEFSAYNQEFTLFCKPRLLETQDYFYQATWWHHRLFSPNLHPKSIILGFDPDWESSAAQGGN